MKTRLALHGIVSSKRALAAWLIFAPVLMSTECQALDNIDQIIDKLGDNDFDVREDALEKLGSLSAKYSRAFLRRGEKLKDDPEIRERLFIAAKKIFESKIGGTDERWLQLWGTLGISYRLLYTYEYDDNWQRPREPMGLIITWVDKEGASDGPLNRWDLITEIDGVAVAKDILSERVRAGAGYALTVKRYTHIDTIGDTGYIDPTDNDFKVLQIKINAGWKAQSEVDQSVAYALMESMWKEFLRDLHDPLSPNLALQE